MLKGQHSWNISVTKEARMDPKVVLESSIKCPYQEIFFAPKKILETNKHTSKMILQALLLVTNLPEPIKGLLTAVHSFFSVVFSSNLQSPLSKTMSFEQWGLKRGLKGDTLAWDSLFLLLP